MKKTIMMLLALLAVNLAATAQQLSGKVTDANGGLEGVTVAEVDKNDRVLNQTTTDANGIFQLALRSDRNKVRVDGLDGCLYCFADVSQVADQTWKGAFVPNGHFDHVFTLAKHEQTITDAGWGRTVVLRGSGYSKIVIWTPEGAFENLTAEDALHFVCVEPATLFRPDAYTLAPGEEHVLSVSIAVSGK